MKTSIIGTLGDFDSIKLIEKESSTSIVITYSHHIPFEQNKKIAEKVPNSSCSGNEIIISNLEYYNSEGSLSRVSFKYGDNVLFQYYGQKNQISFYMV